tara:strand:+ start:813 stop:1955 length:1143 start_codon:yes stop_codon:yes gene_type:complete
MNNKTKDLKSEAYESYIKRISQETIPAYEPSVGQEELTLLTDVINSNWLSEGKYVRRFEEDLRLICGRDYALAFSNCTAALITGMKGLGLGDGDEVIVQSLVHSADPNSIAATGATPVFADVDRESLCLSVEQIDRARTLNTKAVLYVSLYGNASELEFIQQYCNDNKLYLINDCAPALFGEYKGDSIASYGDFSTLSFFADKTITTGEGGMLLTNKIDLIEECNIYKHDGRKERGVDVIQRKGFNYRLTELQAAVGVAQFKKRSVFIKKKKNNYNLFCQLFENRDQVNVFKFCKEGDIVPHRNIIFVPDAEKLISFLVSEGIGARSLFMPMHSQPCYNEKHKFPNTEKLFKTGVCLPSAPSLSEENISYIASKVISFYR